MPGDKTNIEVMIMAAGASRRLGQPKQMIKYQGETLLRRISKEAINAKIGDVTVVTGYDHKNMEEEVGDLDVTIFYNEEWEEGLGASIRNGLNHILKSKPETNAILLTMVDQPFVDGAHLKKLANTYDPSRSMIIASAYSGTFGVPVLFDSRYFEQMKQLKGDEGGKKIFVKYLKDIVEIPFKDGAFDIDEKEDLKSLN
ncbi:MAG: nucleotidyltransferase family protein [Cytophagales bacterium]|nr:nucleotidyltransferase family protein [Cytophagales bacterium]